MLWKYPVLGGAVTIVVVVAIIIIIGTSACGRASCFTIYATFGKRMSIFVPVSTALVVAGVKISWKH